MYSMVTDGYCNEIYDDCQIDLMDEMLPYELIHLLLDDILRLQCLVVETRIEVNNRAKAEELPVYLILDQDIANYTYYDHPAMSRYQELYEEYAIV